MKFWAKEEVIWTLCLFLLLVNLVSCYILHLSLTWWLSLLFLRSNWKLRMIMVGTNEREGPRLPESLIGLALPRLMIPISESFVYLHLRFIYIFGLYTLSISSVCFVVCLIFDVTTPASRLGRANGHYTGHDFSPQMMSKPTQTAWLVKILASEHCVTRGPLLLLRSLVALSFKVCQWVSQWVLLTD